MKKKSYIIDNKLLMSEWDYEKNGELKPEQCTCGSGTKVWWKCKKGHEYEMPISKRANGRNCPYCSNQKVLIGYNDLQTFYPEIAKEWHPTKNGDLKPTQVTPGSNRLIWWICSKGHEYQALVHNRTTKHNNCPYCSGHRTFTGYNDLKTLLPSLAKEWNYEKNGDLKPEQFTPGSHEKVWWKCSKGHEYQMIINKRRSGDNCPYCSSHRFLSGYNDFETLYPEIAKEWDYERNNNLKPSQFFVKDKKKFWWICSICGNVWNASIHSRIQKGVKCPKCITENRKQFYLKKYGCITNPILLKEWNYEKNGDLKPEQFTPGSNKSVWWKCSKCGNEWESRISNRSFLKRGCPYCANHKISKVKDTSSLITKYPELAKQWHPTKNGTLTPYDVLPGTRKKVWWICEHNHEYQASIVHRVHGTNCPICNSGRQTSFAEQAVFYYVKRLYPDAINRYTESFLGRMELDIYIPSIKYAIEYDGEAWHKENKLAREQKKYRICQEHGIKLIRLREQMPPTGSSIADYIWSIENLYEHKNLKNIIKEVITFLDFFKKCNFDVNIKRDRFEIQKYRQILKKDFFSQEYPKIAMEWHPTKNGTLTPNMFRSGSEHKVWWLCPICGNEYEQRIGSRTKGAGCPKCAIEKSAKAKRKAVNMIDINTNKIIRTFISISEASRQMKINDSNISMVCKGKKTAAGGYRWRYAELKK